MSVSNAYCPEGTFVIEFEAVFSVPGKPVRFVNFYLQLTDFSHFLMPVKTFAALVSSSYERQCRK